MNFEPHKWKIQMYGQHNGIAAESNFITRSISSKIYNFFINLLINFSFKYNHAN